jgi:hypothetical protein
MARHKRKNPLLAIAQTYLVLHMPELRATRLQIRMLDGPPGGPRYAVTAELCTTARCPYGVAQATADSGECPVHNCPLRDSVRLLMNRRGDVVQSVRSGIHWI